MDIKKDNPNVDYYHNNLEWKDRLSSDYEPIGKTTKIWEKCKKCLVRPRLWIFNNGCFAACLCFHLYDNDKIRAESVMSFYKRNNTTKNYDGREELRINWNLFCLTGSNKKLKDGQW